MDERDRRGVLRRSTAPPARPSWRRPRRGPPRPRTARPRCARRRSRCPAPVRASTAGHVEPPVLRRRWPPARRGRRSRRPPSSTIVRAGPRGLEAHRVGHREHLGAEPARLGGRAAGQVGARQPRGEAEVVLDPRALPGLAARRLALDQHRLQPLRRAVHRRRQPGRARRRRSPGRRTAAPPASAARAARRSRAGRRRVSTLAVGEHTHRQRRAAAARRRPEQRAAPRVRSTSSQRYGTWLRARKSLSSWSSARPAVADHPHRPRPAAGAGLPVAEQVVEHRVEPLLRRVPRLEQVVVEPDLVDRSDGGVGVGVGGQQHALGVGRELASPAPGTRCRSSPASAGRPRTGPPARSRSAARPSTPSASAPDVRPHARGSARRSAAQVPLDGARDPGVVVDAEHHGLGVARGGRRWNGLGHSPHSYRIGAPGARGLDSVEGDGRRPHHRVHRPRLPVGVQRRAVPAAARLALRRPASSGSVRMVGLSESPEDYESEGLHARAPGRRLPADRPRPRHADRHRRAPADGGDASRPAAPSSRRALHAPEQMRALLRRLRVRDFARRAARRAGDDRRRRARRRPRPGRARRAGWPAPTSRAALREDMAAAREPLPAARVLDEQARQLVRRPALHVPVATRSSAWPTASGSPCRASSRSPSTT